MSSSLSGTRSLCLTVASRRLSLVSIRRLFPLAFFLLPFHSKAIRLLLHPRKPSLFALVCAGSSTRGLKPSVLHLRLLRVLGRASGSSGRSEKRLGKLLTRQCPANRRSWCLDGNGKHDLRLAQREN